jgi:flagellar motor switch/type III secretory pathway protein FliN
MRRPTWPAPGRRSRIERPDPAPAVLGRVASGIAKRASAVLRADVTVTIETPARCALERVYAGRAWRCDDAGVGVWLVLDDGALRALLEIVLGGPAAAVPTTLERDIVRETVERLCASDEVVWQEAASGSAFCSDAWRSDVSIAAQSGPRARLTLAAPAPPPPSPGTLPRVEVGGIPISVGVAIAPSRMRLAEVLTWQPGSIVALGADGTPSVSVFADTEQIASGRLGASRGRRAVRLETVATESPR